MTLSSLPSMTAGSRERSCQEHWIAVQCMSPQGTGVRDTRLFLDSAWHIVSIVRVGDHSSC